MKELNCENPLIKNQANLM